MTSCFVELWLAEKRNTIERRGDDDSASVSTSERLTVSLSSSMSSIGPASVSHVGSFVQVHFFVLVVSSVVSAGAIDCLQRLLSDL